MACTSGTIPNINNTASPAIQALRPRHPCMHRRYPESDEMADVTANPTSASNMRRQLPDCRERPLQADKTFEAAAAGLASCQSPPPKRQHCGWAAQTTVCNLYNRTRLSPSLSFISGHLLAFIRSLPRINFTKAEKQPAANMTTTLVFCTSDKVTPEVCEYQTPAFT